MIEPHILEELPDSMIDEIQYEIPEAGRDLVQHFLRKSAIRFCELSHFWQEDCDTFVIEDGVENYFIETGFNAKKAVSVVKVVDEDGNEYERSQNGGVDYYYWQPSPDTIEIYSSTEIVGKTITASVALSPVVIDDDFLISAQVISNYRDAIIDGAKHYLYASPRKDWTDFNLSGAYESKFMQVASEAKRSRSNGFSRLHGRAPKKVREFF